MKQPKENSFWKPMKTNSVSPIKISPLFNFPKSNHSNDFKKSGPVLTSKFIPKSNFLAVPKIHKSVQAINMNTNVSKKDMSWFQAQSKFPKLKPFGDADKDGVINMNDCRPFNKMMHYLKGGPAEAKRRLEKEVKEREDALKITKVKMSNEDREYARKVLQYEKLSRSKKAPKPVFESDIKDTTYKEEIKPIRNAGYRPAQIGAPLEQKQKSTASTSLTIIQKRAPKTELGMDSKQIRELQRKRERALATEQSFEWGTIKSGKDMRKLVGEINRKTREELEKELRTKENIIIAKERKRAKIELAKIAAKEREQKRNIKIKAAEKEVELLTRIKTKGEANIAKIKIAEIEAAPKLERNLRLRKKEEEQFAISGQRQANIMLSKVSKIAALAKGRTRQDRWVSGEKLLEKAKARDVMLGKYNEEPEKIKTNESKSAMMTKMRFREIEERLEREREEKYGPREPKEPKGTIIFDMPVKSKLQRFKESVFKESPKIIVGETISTNKYVALPTLKREKYLTKEEKEIGERKIKEMKKESPYEVNTRSFTIKGEKNVPISDYIAIESERGNLPSNYGTYKRKKGYAEDIVREVEKEAKDKRRDTVERIKEKMEKREEQKMREEEDKIEKENKKELKKEAVREAKENIKERKEIIKEAKEEYKTEKDKEYESSAQKLIDEA